MSSDVGAEVFTVLDQLGLTNYVVPFILVFTALYAVTMKTKVPTDRADLNGILSFTLAYLFVAFGGGKMINAIIPFFLIMFLILFIALLFFLFIGASSESVVKAFTNPVIVFMIVSFLVLFTFIGLQDWLVFSDRIPAWQVSETGELIVEDRIGGEYPGNVTNVTNKPHSIIVDGNEYELIQGIYYKQGYEGAAYAIGQPQVVAGIFILIILGIATALIVWPKK